MFDVMDHLDELRSWPTTRLAAHHERLVRVVRRLQLEDLDVLRVLDERGQIDPTVGRDGESARTVREKLETARALESLPAVAAAAHAGDLSLEQLGPVARLADEDSDAEWAARAPNTAPAELARLARNAVKPSTEDSRARFAARGLRMWWAPGEAMLHVRGQLPDVMGAKFEATITKLTEQMRPPKGRAWDSFDHRAADALLSLCDESRAQNESPSLAPRPVLSVHVPLRGPAEIAGVPIADTLLEQLRANASIEPVLVDDDGTLLVVGKRTTVLSSKISRAVLLRDGHCRVPGCDVTFGLHVHHLRPRSWCGTDDIANLAAVCTARGHHPMLVPHGPWALVGNPNRPDGLRLVHLEHLTEEGAEQLGRPPPRAGPRAA